MAHREGDEFGQCKARRVRASLDLLVPPTRGPCTGEDAQQLGAGHPHARECSSSFEKGSRRAECGARVSHTRCRRSDTSRARRLKRWASTQGHEASVSRAFKGTSNEGPDALEQLTSRRRPSSWTESVDVTAVSGSNRRHHLHRRDRQIASRDGSQVGMARRQPRRSAADICRSSKGPR